MGNQPGMPGSQFPGEDAQGRKIKDLERAVQQFAAANVLATAGISATTGGVIVTLQTLLFLTAYVFAPKHGVLAARRRQLASEGAPA